MRKEGFPEVTGEPGIPIRYNDTWNPVKLEDVVEEDLGKFRSRDSCRRWHAVKHLGETVHYHVNGIVAVPCLGQASDEIHSHLFPAMAWQRQGLQESRWPLVARFVALAGITGAYEFTDVIRHHRPVEVALNALLSFSYPDALRMEYRGVSSIMR